MTVRPIRDTPDESKRTGFVELGATNATRMGSTLYQDFIPQLRGRRAARVYEEMAWNDATIGSILYAVEQLIRQVDWTVESDDPRTLEFLEANIKGLRHSWDDFIAAALTELVYGWAVFEVVYQVVDGQLWWHKFAFRAQDTLHEWILDEVGELEAFAQVTRGGGKVIIPAQKLIHFRTNPSDGRPEGRSWLRRAYRAWYFKKRVEDIVTIGIDRDLNGVPIARIPPDVLLAGPGDAQYDAAKKIVTGLKVDELQGILWPKALDPDTGADLWDLDLLSTSGRGKTDPLAFIRVQSMDIAAVMLAQFVGLGRDAVGSRALAEPQQELFQTALGALLDSIEEQFHRQATEILLRVNGLEEGRIVHGELRDLDLEGISNFILRTAQAGATWFDPEGGNMDELRQIAGMQPVEAVEIEAVSTTTTPTRGAEVEGEGD